MDIRRKRFIAAFINGIIIAMIFFLRYSGIATFKIGEAVPILLLPVMLSISIFFSENAALLAGLFCGMLMDSAAADTSCFNTIFFVLSATLCSVLANRFFNRNLKSAVCLSALLSLAYFFFKYLILFVPAGITVGYNYFATYLIPSAVYTAVWIIPFYFLQKKLRTET